MELILLILGAICFLAAIIFGSAGLLGLFRYPDPYARLQAGSLCGTTAVFSVFLGTLALAPSGAVAARIIIISLLFMVSAPTGSHIVSRFIWNSGITPWRPSYSRSLNTDAPSHKKKKKKGKEKS